MSSFIEIASREIGKEFQSYMPNIIAFYARYINRDLPQQWIERILQTVGQSTTSIELIQPLLHEISQYILASTIAQAQKNVTFAKLYKALFNSSFGKLILQEMFSIVPRLPSAVSSVITIKPSKKAVQEHEAKYPTHWSAGAEKLAVFYCGILAYIFNSAGVSELETGVTLLFERYEQWIPLDFYATNTFTLFLQKIRGATVKYVFL
jgi:hypothetical protein